MKNQDGYIALITVIILSIILESIVFSSSLQGYFAQKTISQSLYKEQSFYLALSCAQEAALELKQNLAMFLPVYIQINNNLCSINAVTEGNQEFVILTSSSVEGFITKLETRVRSSDFSIISSKELI